LVIVLGSFLKIELVVYLGNDTKEQVEGQEERHRKGDNTRMHYEFVHDDNGALIHWTF
jgi:hypothetical protein